VSGFNDEKGEIFMSEKMIRVRFREEMDRLQDEVVRLGSMVDDSLRRAIEALQDQDQKLEREIISDDAQINNLRFAIEEHCFKILAQQSPMAGDLRAVVAVVNIVLDLERMGDHAAGIATVGLQIDRTLPTLSLGYLLKMTEIARDMLRQSLDAFVRKNGQLAQSIIMRDDDVDQLYTQLFREMVACMLKDQHTIAQCMYLLFIGHNLERIADRVTNICERVVFLTTGNMAETPSDHTNVTLSDDLLNKLRGQEP
jgi:phosphate transport system protein